MVFLNSVKEILVKIVKAGKVIRKIYSKKESYSLLVQTNERSDIVPIKEKLENLKAELSTY